MALGELKTNKKCDKLMEGKNVVLQTKSRMIALLGHLERKEKHLLTKKFTT
jgi:hypothetical protein